MKRAVFESALVGGTKWDRDQYNEHDAAAAYDSFYVCVGYARATKGAWCECPRGKRREFENDREKDSPVLWVTK